MRQKPDAGVSLIEVLIALAIMGIAVVGILGALVTQLSGGRVHRDQANAATVVSSAAERVKAAGYVSACGSAPAAYLTAARQASLPSDWIEKGWTASQAITLDAVTPVRYWDGSDFTATCNDGASGDTAGVLRLQQVYVRVQGPEGGPEQLIVVKTGAPAP